MHMPEGQKKVTGNLKSSLLKLLNAWLCGFGASFVLIYLPASSPRLVPTRGVHQQARPQAGSRLSARQPRGQETKHASCTATSGTTASEQQNHSPTTQPLPSVLTDVSRECPLAVRSWRNHFISFCPQLLKIRV